MNKNERSFLSFITEYDVKIPIIQRDYVQGRNNNKAKEIRKSFIKNIFDCLKNNSEKLNLEFIYGNIINNCFEPIDGQQRLTTMYLVTIFLALQEEKEEELSKIKTLSYEVRTSSQEFCRELREKLKKIPNENIKEYIKFQNWYDSCWENDQTIESMLEVLNVIQENYNEIKAKDNTIKLFENLEKIKFNFIDTREEKLNEDTYIKLNARGLPLSDFEQYKSSFLEYDNFKKDYENDIDTKWNDWIWRKINKDDYKENNSIFDLAFYGIFNTILTNEYVQRIDLDKQKNNNLEFLTDNTNILFSEYKKMIGNEDEVGKIVYNIGKIFNFFVENKIEDKERLNKFIDFKQLVEENLILSYKEKNESNRNRLKSNEERCEFYCICLYIIENYEKLDEEDFIQWTRLSRNVIQNIRTNDEFIIVLKLLKELHEQIQTINLPTYLERISKLNMRDENVKGRKRFFNEKLNDEIIKAKAMLINDEWKKLIQTNDENKFISGETNFLLIFCGIQQEIKKNMNNENYFIDEKTKQEALKKYKQYTNLINIIVSDKMIDEDIDKVIDDEFNEEMENDQYKLLTRCLFAVSEWNNLTEFKNYMFDTEYGYLLTFEKSHYSFFANNDDRDYSWKNIFKKENISNSIYLKILMDYMITNNVDNKREFINHLKKIIKNSNVSNWKKYFIKDSKIFKILNSRYNLLKIEKFINDKAWNVFLLNSKVDSGNVLPLWFLSLYEKAQNENIQITAYPNKSIQSAWTQGVYSLKEKKRIIKINEYNVDIYMNREEDKITYYKNISNLPEDLQSKINQFLNEIQAEFSLHFNNKEE